MKRHDLRRALSCILVASALSVGAMGCLASAFSMAVQWDRIITACVLTAALALLCADNGVGLLCVLPAAQLLHQTPWEALATQVEALLWTISCAMHDILRTRYTIWWTTDDHTGRDVTALLSLLGMLLALTAVRDLRRGKTGASLAFGLSAVLPCLLMSAHTPRSLWLALFLGALLALLLTQAQRAQEVSARRAAVSGRALLAAALIPCLLIGLLSPSQFPDTQEPPLRTLLAQLRNALTPTDPGDDPGGAPSFVPGTVDLRSVGKKSASERKVFSVLCSQETNLYLRQAGYTAYTGSRWETAEQTEIFAANDDYLQVGYETVELTFSTVQTRRMIPYYCAETLVNGYVANEFGLGSRSYAMDYAPLQSDYIALWRANVGGTAAQQTWDDSLAPYLQLSDSTLAAATRILLQLRLAETTDIPETAQRIADYVRSSAEYSLDTEKMPDSETDFAIWFLNESESGYCVHFATAAAVLLRAAGIPARYVRGYLVHTEANEAVSARVVNAHAWTEYYLPEVGWVVLDATPGGSSPEPTTPIEPSAPTEPTIPAPTEPVTATEPTEPTKPAPTVPRETIPAPTSPVAAEPSEPDRAPLPASVRMLLWLAALAAATAVQYRLRLRRRRRRMAACTPNERALLQWHYTCRLARAAKLPLPPQLRELAEKAKFSPHTLTAEELSAFSTWQAACIACLRRRNILHRAVDRLIFALY